MSTFQTLCEMLRGGVAINLPADPDRPDGPALIRTVVQLDGDILSRVSPALMEKSSEAIDAELERHVQAVRAALRPIGRLKSAADWLGNGIAALGAGTALGSAARAAVTADTGDPLAFLGAGAAAVPLGFAIPVVLGSQLRQAVGAMVFVARSRPGRWLLRRLV